MIKIPKEHTLQILKLVKKKNPIVDFYDLFTKLNYSEEQFDKVFKSLQLSKEQIILNNKSIENKYKLDRTLKIELRKLASNKESLEKFYVCLKQNGVSYENYDETLIMYGHDPKILKKNSETTNTAKAIGGALLLASIVLTFVSLSSGMGIIVCGSLATLGFYMLLTGETPL